MEFENIPCDVWETSLTPLLDRADWNALLEASKPFYELVQTKSIAPPWPTKCFGIRGSQSITSFTMSPDGEYLAAGSTLGSIDIWSRRRGKITSLRKRDPLTSGSRSDTNNESAGQRRRSQPIGSVLKFAPQGHTLASAHENRIFLQEITDLAGRNPCQVLEVECRHGTIYEVTYLGFSKDGNHLIARYGKTAFVWKRTQQPSPRTCASMSTSQFVLTHKFSLSSSRCQITSSPCMRFVAVANAGSAEKKGNIDMWTIGGSAMDDDAASLSCNTIQAHEKKTIRGLEFVTYNETNALIEDDDSHFLLSATLQGEIKIWKHQPLRSNICCHDVISNEPAQSGYVCTKMIKVTGKIFSLATLASPGLSVANQEEVCLGLGQSRGRVRVFKINLWWSDDNLNTVDDSTVDDNSTSESTSLVQPSSHNSDDSEETINETSSSNDVLQDFLSLDVVGEQTHHDNMKLLQFSPDGRHLVASRAYDARIWFHAFQS